VSVGDASWQAAGFERIDARHGDARYDDTPVVLKLLLRAAAHATTDAERRRSFDQATELISVVEQRLARGDLDFGYPSREAASEFVDELDVEWRALRTTFESVD